MNIVAEKTETIGIIKNKKSGKTYPVAEYHADTGTLELIGEFEIQFSGSVQQAVRSGYTLENCSEERLRQAWNITKESLAQGIEKTPGAEKEMPKEEAEKAGSGHDVDGRENVDSEMVKTGENTMNTGQEGEKDPFENIDF